MREYWARLLERPTAGVEASVATVFIAMLGLAQPLAAINIFNNYLLFGLGGTLLVIASGAALAVVFEAVLRQARLRTLRQICDRRDTALFGRPEIPAAMDKFSVIRKAFGPRSMSEWLDVPSAFAFVIVLLFIHWSLAAGVASILSLVYAIGWLNRLNTGEVMMRRQDAMREVAASNGDTFEHAFAGMIEQDNQMEARQSFLGAIQKMLAGIVSVLTLSLGALLAFDGVITPGELIAANILAGRSFMILSKWNGGSEALLIGQAALVQLQRLGVAGQEAPGVAENRRKIVAV